MPQTTRHRDHVDGLDAGAGELPEVMALDARERRFADELATCRCDAVRRKIDLWNRDFAARIEVGERLGEKADVVGAEVRHPRAHVGSVVGTVPEQMTHPIDLELVAHAGQVRRNATFIAHLWNGRCEEFVSIGLDTAASRARDRHSS